MRAHLRSIKLKRFPDGESLVTIDASAHDKDVIVIESLDHPDEKLIQLTFVADALRRAGVRSVTLVAPYLAYMRQDKVFHTGESLSQQVIGALLARTFDRVITIEPHLHRTKSIHEVIPSRLVSKAPSAAPVIAEWIRKLEHDAIILGPDEESRPCIVELGRLTGLPTVVGAKRRSGDRSVHVELPFLGSHPRALIVDDIASSGATIAAAARALKRKAVRHVAAIVVHAIFSPGALTRIRQAGVGTIVSCDTVEHRTNRISVAPIIAYTLQTEHERART
jgi:ribose-phosphate pyrophosphokinase